MKGSLSQILQSLNSKPIKKLSPAVISDVYTRCVHVSDLANIISSGYFETVLWRFLHSDVSNSHLELLLLACAYESEVRMSGPVVPGVPNSCMNLMLSDPEKLHTLMVRILQSTMVFREKEHKLQGAIFTFLRALVLQLSASSPSESSPSESPLFGNSLFPKWKDSLSTYISQNLAVLDGFSSELLFIIHSFLSLLLVCVRLRNDLGSHFQDVWVYFLGETFDFSTNRLASLLLAETSKINYLQFVGTVESLHLSHKIPSVNEPSHYDITAPTLSHELGSLAEPELQKLAKKLLAGHHFPDSLLADALSYSVTGSKISPERLRNPTQFNEEDIFDLFEPCQKSVFCPGIAPYTGPFEADRWTDHLRQQYAHHVLKQYNERCLAVFSRLKIDDPALENGISGSSKYFSMVSNIVVNGSIANIRMKKNLTFETDQFCLLIELLKPNKFEATQRMIQYGVNAAHVMRVSHCNADTLSVQWNAPGYEDRFNAVVLLPKTVYPTYPIQPFPLILKPKKSEPKKTESTESEPTKAEPIEPDAKKRKLEKPSTPDETDIASILKHPIACIQSPGLELPTINQVLNNLQTTCLVILPTERAVDLFPRRANCYRVDSLDEDLTLLVQKKDSLLHKVQQMSEYLGLGEYSFGKSVQNALMLYESHIEPKWQSFLRHLSESTYGDYPFRQFSDVPEKNMPEKIIQDFTNIRKTFAELQDLVVLDVAQGDVSQIRRYLLKTANTVVVPETKIEVLDRDFDTVVVFNPSIVPFLGGYKKLVVMNWAVPAGIPVMAMKCPNRESREAEHMVNAGTLQYIRTTKHSDQASLEEARDCMYLFQYLRSQGVPRPNISICCKSKYMEMLLAELIAEDSQFSGLGNETSPGTPIVQETGQIFASEYLIVSTEGGFGFQDMQEILAKSTKVYLFGADAKLPFNISAKPLQLEDGTQVQDLAQLQKLAKSIE